MQKLIAATSLALATLVANAADRLETDFRCLSGGPNRSIRLEWRTFTDISTSWTVANVRYKNAKAPITLVLKGEEATEKPEGRPWEFTSTWVEVIDGKITGEYEIVSQGAIVYSFRYKNRRNGRTIDFTDDNDAYQEDHCAW